MHSFCKRLTYTIGSISIQGEWMLTLTIFTLVKSLFLIPRLLSTLKALNHTLIHLNHKASKPNRFIEGL